MMGKKGQMPRDIIEDYEVEWQVPTEQWFCFRIGLGQNMPLQAKSYGNNKIDL